MKRSSFFAALIAAALLLTASPSLAQYGDFRGSALYAEHIAFTYSEAVLGVPQARLSPHDAPPQYTEIYFEKPVEAEGEGMRETGSYIRVYAVSDFEAGGYYQQSAAELRALLTNSTTIPTTFPVIPFQTPIDNAGAVQFINFLSGAGVRFTGDYSGSGSLYGFQGLTNDGIYYIAAWFVIPPQDRNAFAFYEALIQSLNLTSPEAQFAANGETLTVDYAGVRFAVPGDLASRVDVSRLNDPDEPIRNMSWLAPEYEYTRFSLYNYPIITDTQFPRILIIPTETFLPNTPYSAELDRLRAILTAPDEQLMPAIGILTDLPPFPVLPLRSTVQLLAVQPRRLTFANGSGYRFVTAYARNTVPITSNDIFYVFQGLTDDESHIVAAFLPVRSPVLPLTVEGIDFEELASNYEGYLTRTFEALNADSRFTPILTNLDAIMESISVE